MKRALLIGVLLLSAILLFAGGKAEEQRVKEDLEGGPVKLRILFPGTSEIERQWSLDVTERVKELYPNYELEFIYLVWADMEPKLVSMLQAKDYPDIIMTQDMANYVAMEALEPLDDYFGKGSNPVRKDSFIESALEYSVYDGKIYSVPVVAVSYGLLVNEQMLNAAGMNLGELKTWADIRKAAELMTKGDQYGYSIASGVGRFVFRDALISSASNGFNPGEVDKEKQYKEMLHLYMDLAPFMPEAQVTWAYPELFRAYCDGRIGMIAQGTYFSANVYSINPEIINVTRVVPFPAGPSVQQTSSLVSNAGFAMIRQSRNKEAAWNVLKVMYEKELSAKIAAGVNITARTDISADLVGQFAQEVYPEVLEGHKRILDDFVSAAAATGTTMPRVLGQSQMENVFQKQLLDMIAGTISVDQAYQNIKKEFTAIKAQF